MTQTRLNQPACERIRAKLDSYIDSELLTETNLELMEHLDRCEACTQEAQERRKVRTRLRAAVRDVPVPAGLEARVRDRLRQKKQPQHKKFFLLAVAAALAAVAVFRLHDPAGPLLSLGFDDHVHCAVLHHPRPAGDANRLPERIRHLTPVVQEHVPAGLPLILAHECRDHGRGFFHLTFGDGRHLMSVVITRRQDGESLGAGMRLASREPYQLAAFQAGDYFVYAVSDLPPKENAQILTALAPSIQNFL
jgi:anti-sigma factor RsiW